MMQGKLRAILAISLGLGAVPGTAGTPAHADDWQPIVRVPQPPAPPARLGKPIVPNAPGAAAATTVPSAPVASTSAKLGSPKTVIRAQGPDIRPVAPAPGGAVDERFACGEVMTAPATGPAPPPPPTWTGPSSSHTWLGNVISAPVNWVKSWGFSFESDHSFDEAGFISPSSNPFFFEDPRALTEVRPVLLFEKSPGGNPLVDKSFFFGLQARVAFSPYFSLVVHKLGGIKAESNGGIVPDSTDFAELWLGGKFTFLRNEATGSIAAFGLNFELPTGGSDTFQNTGDGAVTPYLSYAQQLWTNWHFMTTFGYRIGFDDERSDSLFLSLHLDYNVAGLNRFFPFVEFTWFHYTSNGNLTAVGNEGRDLYNFGASNVSGNDIVTMAVGMRFKITPCIEFGAYYEFPISNREDLIDSRVGLDVLFRY